MNDLPERINVIRTVSYATEHMLADVALSNEISEDEVTTDMLLDWISDWVWEDMTSAPSRHDLVYQDENGNEL